MLPDLARECCGDVCVWTDPELEASRGILVAFSERGGGVSGPPFTGLNLAAHSGDDASLVDANRDRLLESLGIWSLRERLTTAEQVHGDRVAVVDERDAGAGARTASPGIAPIAGVDSLLTTRQGIPLLLLFADCVPLVLVAPQGLRGVAVVHAGWRGAAAGVHLVAAERLCSEAACEPSDLLAYVGPRVCERCYEVGPEVLSHFERASGTIARAPGRLDLGSRVSSDLERAGVRNERIVLLDRCTVENTGEFFSYRAEAITGRHGALALIQETST